MPSNTTEPTLSHLSFLSGGGEMKTLIRSKDWSATPLGSIETWPQSLCTALSIILNSKFPMFIFWGPELRGLYNDAYRPSLGNQGRHPDILGIPGEEAWPDIWPVIKPSLQQVMDGGESTWAEDQLIPIYRNGLLEDVYWTFSYSPVMDESGKPGGVFVACTETTEKVLELKKAETNEQQFRNTVKQAPMGIVILKGKEFVVETVNDAYLKLVDKEEHSFLGKPLFDSLPEVREIVEPLLTNVLETGTPYHANELMVNLLRHGKNETGYFNIVYQPYKEIDGIISGIMVVAHEVTVSVKARHTLGESEKQFRNLVMQSPIPMTIFRGPDHIIEMANKEMFKNIWRKEEADVVGRKVLDVFPELKNQKYPELLKSVLVKGHVHREEESIAYVQGDDGMKKFYLDFEYSPLFETNGTVSGIMITVNDVTEKVEAREKIKDNEEKLRIAIEAASLGTFIIDLVTNELEHSERFLEIFGFHGSDTPARQDILERIYPEDMPTRQRAYDAALRTGILEYEARILFNKKTRWIRVKGKVIFDASKKPLRILGTAIDITKEKNTLRLIEESEVRLRIATEGTKLATWDLDLNTYEILHSPRLAEIFGYDKPKIMSHHEMRMQLHPDDRENIVEKAFQRALKTGVYEYEARVIRPDKTQCWIKTQGNVIFDRHRVPLRMIGTMADITESKSDEEKLAKLAAIVQSSEDGIISKRPDGIITSWNSAAERIFGYTADEMIGFSILKLIPDDRLEEEQQIIARLRNGERITAFETKRLRKNKTSFDISLTVSPIKDAQGNLIGASKIVRDITEQKLIERQISESEHRLNIAAEAAELGTWELNFNSDEAVYSKRYLEILGFDPSSSPNHDDITKGVHPDDLETRNNAINEAIKNGLLDIEMRIVANDTKAIKWIKSRGRVIYDAAGKPEKMMGTTMDITEEKLKSAELKISEERFRLLANAMPQLVWTGDKDGNLNYFNQSVYSYSGLSKEVVDKDGWLQIVHPDEREENIKRWSQSVTTGEDFLFEHRFLKHNGEYRWQLSRAVPQRDTNGNIKMWVGTSTDIHEIKENEQQKDLFISIASHELKTPITSIKGYVQILMSMYNEGKDDFLKNSLSIVNKQIITLTNLIGDLLDLSKIKSGSLQLQQEKFSLNVMVQEIIKDVQHTEPSHTIDFAPGHEVSIYADKDRIGQVLINFLTNAIKYSPNASMINVKSIVEGDYAIVSVADKGIGINKMDQEKIFERFYRVEGKNEKTFPGFGIGLFIASEIIHRHEGKIKVESEPGKGSVFSFLLPIQKH